MVPMYYVTLEYWQNNNIILTPYKLKINITSSTKRTLMVRIIFIFSLYARFHPFIYLDQSYIYRKSNFRYFFNVIDFWHYLLLISKLPCSLFIPIEGYHDSLYVIMFFSPMICSISGPYSSSICLNLNSLSVLSFYR